MVGKKVTPARPEVTKCPESMEGEKMPLKIRLSRMPVVASMWLILASGCASSPVQSPGSFIKQDPMTSHMRSQVGTPNELSPLAPAQATKVQKVGDHWTCELHGQAMIFNDAASRWEPR